jgi:hypothetical protein
MELIFLQKASHLIHCSWWWLRTYCNPTRSCLMLSPWRLLAVGCQITALARAADTSGEGCIVSPISEEGPGNRMPSVFSFIQRILPNATIYAVTRANVVHRNAHRWLMKKTCRRTAYGMLQKVGNPVNGVCIVNTGNRKLLIPRTGISRCISGYSYLAILCSNEWDPRKIVHGYEEIATEKAVREYFKILYRWCTEGTKECNLYVLWHARLFTTVAKQLS